MHKKKIDFVQIMNWFDGLNQQQKNQTLIKARICLDQSNPNEQILNDALEKVPLKPTMTPIVIFKTNNFKNALHKIASLPENENRKTFITLISIFKVADTKRRITWCKDGCSHEWHNLDKY